jgi:hypothetical protein
MSVSPLQALQAASRPIAPAGTSSTSAGAPTGVVIAGATGALGQEVLRRLVGAPGVGAILRGVSAAQVDDQAIEAWPLLAAGTGLILFDPPRLYHDRERALWAPDPAQLVRVATWMRRSGVTTLAVVQPHDQGRLPEALKRGLASLDEHALATLGFERLLLVRSARKPGAGDPTASFLARTADWMLSIFRYMLPTSEQPVRASKVAELVLRALQTAPPGIHIAPPELVWQAAQGDLAGVVARWLRVGLASAADEGVGTLPPAGAARQPAAPQSTAESGASP